MRIVITGGAGFLGSRLARALLARGSLEAPQPLRLISRQIETGYFEILGANELRPVDVRCVVVSVHERFLAWQPTCRVAP